MFGRSKSKQRSDDVSILFANLLVGNAYAYNCKSVAAVVFFEKLLFSQELVPIVPWLFMAY